MRSTAVVRGDEGETSERDALALAIHEALRDSIEGHVDEQWRYMKMVGAGAALVCLVGIGLAATGQASTGILVLLLGAAAGIGGGAYIRSREPETTVKSIQKGYWTGHLVPAERGTVVFDATETIQPSRFQLNLLESPERAAEINELLDVEEFPVVMTEEWNVEDDFLDNLSRIQSEIRNSVSHEVSAPVLENDDPAVETLSRVAATADADPIDAGGVALTHDDAEEKLQTFREFESMADEDHGESVLLDVSKRSREIARELSGLQETATDLLNDHIQTAGDMFGLISYAFYCPDCWDDDIESRLDLIDREGEWYCETCRSNFGPSEGIARHRIRDEVVLDVWDQLWIEKDDQRRQIYESIEDQKSELEEREFEQRREEIRTVEGRIKDIRAKIRDLQTEAKAKQGTVEEIGRLMVKYERLQEQRLREFERDVTDSFTEIDEETERVLEETEGIIEERLEEAEREAKEREEAMREEERQRERERVAHEQVRADGRAAATGAAIMGTIAALHDNKPSRRGK